MFRAFFTIVLFFIIIIPQWAVAGEKEGPARNESTESEDVEIVVSGKVFCSLKRQVAIPFQCTVSSLEVRSGQTIKKGEVLARFCLKPEAALNLRRNILSSKIKDLEMTLAEVEIALADLKGRLEKLDELEGDIRLGEVHRNIADLKDKLCELDSVEGDIRLAEVEKNLAHLREREGKLDRLEGDIRLAEVEKNLADLRDKERELKNLAESDLAPVTSLSKVNREIELLTKKQTLIREKLPLESKRLNREIQLLIKKRAHIQKRIPLEREKLCREIKLLSKKRSLLQKRLPLEKKQIKREVEFLSKKRALIMERLPLERSLEKQELTLIGKRLGTVVSKEHIPEKGVLHAPISGHIIWIHPDFREGAEIGSGVFFRIGVMETMLIRAQIHEIEAVQLKLGDIVDFSSEAIPGRKFKAEVSRISWSTVDSKLDQPSYYLVEFEVPNPELSLREGLRGRVTFRKSR